MEQADWQVRGLPRPSQDSNDWVLEGYDTSKPGHKE